MTWPTSAINTTNVDAGTDSPALARADIDSLAIAVNAMIAYGAPLPLAGGTMAGGLYEKEAAVSTSNIDTSAGSLFAKTITAATTLTVSNVPASGIVCSFILDITNGGAYAITWWSGMKWPGGSQPTLTSSGRDVLGFFTYDGGTTWTGLLMGRDVK